MTRRKLLKCGQWISAALVGGFFGGIPWRIYDFVIKPRQNVPESRKPQPVRVEADSVIEVGGHVTPPTVRRIIET